MERRLTTLTLARANTPSTSFIRHVSPDDPVIANGRKDIEEYRAKRTLRTAQ